VFYKILYRFWKKKEKNIEETWIWHLQDFFQNYFNLDSPTRSIQLFGITLVQNILLSNFQIFAEKYHWYQVLLQYSFLSSTQKE